MFSDSGSTLAGTGLSVCSTKLFWIVDVTVMNLVFFTEPTCEKKILQTLEWLRVVIIYEKKLLADNVLFYSITQNTR